jgi:hypothetical protein
MSRCWVTSGIVVRIFVSSFDRTIKGAWASSLTLVGLLFRCGAHLSNLALGSSRKAQSSVGSNLVQVASHLEVVWAVYPWPDVVFVMTGHVRSVLTSHYVVNWSTGRGPWEDQTRWSVWHVFQRVNVQSDMTVKWSDASGHVPVRSQADLTRPVIYDRMWSSVRSKFS